MNLFVVSKCPQKCAAFLDNKRVVKMCLETAQILSSALRNNGYKGTKVYKATHLKHPVVVWCGKTRLNFLWTVEYLQALCGEYTRRFGKQHSCEKMILDFLRMSMFIPQGFRTKFVNCAGNKSLGISYKDLPDVHTAYALYLNDRWDTDKTEPSWAIKVD